MRTTIEFDDDVAAAVARLRRERGMGVSEVVNDLVRSGLIPRGETTAFRQPTHKLGIKLDVSNTGETLDLLEGPNAR